MRLFQTHIDNEGAKTRVFLENPWKHMRKDIAVFTYLWPTGGLLVNWDIDLEDYSGHYHSTPRGFQFETR